MESLVPERLATSLGSWDVWQQHVYSVDATSAERMDEDWSAAVSIAEEYSSGALHRAGYLTTDPLYDYDHVMGMS